MGTFGGIVIQVGPTPQTNPKRNFEIGKRGTMSGGLVGTDLENLSSRTLQTVASSRTLNSSFQRWFVCVPTHHNSKTPSSVIFE